MKNFGYKNSELSQRVALVTGAGRGIGRTTALMLARRGAKIVAVSRSQENLQELESELRRESGEGSMPAHLFLTLDLVASSGPEKLLEFLAEKGFPHIVVANLHQRRESGRLGNNKFELDGKSVLENIAYLKAILPSTLLFQRQVGFGRWVGVSSMVASMGGPGQGLYTVQKGVLENLLRTLALEEATHNITANIVSPGLVDTPGVRENYGDELFEKISAMNLMGRAASPEEIAYAIAFLVSPYASYITGVTLPVCGGYNLSWSLQQQAAQNSAVRKGEEP